MLLCNILYHFKSLRPSNSMSQKINHDFKENILYVRIGSLEPMRIKNILTWQKIRKLAFQNMSNTHDIKFGKDIKTIIVYTSLLSFRLLIFSEKVFFIGQLSLPLCLTPPLHDSLVQRGHLRSEGVGGHCGGRCRGRGCHVRGTFCHLGTQWFALFY